MYTSEKELIVQYCHLLYNRNLVSGYDGNISMKVSNEHILITKSKVNKGMITIDDIFVCDITGNVIEGEGKASKEFPMHHNIYQEDQTITAIIHTHPPFATAFAVAGENIPDNYLIETKVILKNTILVPYAKPGSQELAEKVRDAVKYSHVLLLQNHGVITSGGTLIDAFNAMEITENIAKTIIFSKIVCNPVPIKQEELDKL